MTLSFFRTQKFVMTTGEPAEPRRESICLDSRLRGNDKRKENKNYPTKLATSFFIYSILFLFVISTASNSNAYAAAMQPPTASNSTSETPSITTNAPLSSDNINYLTSVYQDTWNYLATFVEPSTGLPYDSNKRQPATSISNVGLYIAATSIAFRTGLISQADAVTRIGQALTSLQQVESWRGFPRVWVAARSLTPINGTEEFSYSKHISNLIGGLIITETTFPEQFGEQITNYMSSMDFGSMYDPKTGWVKGGYDMGLNDYAIWQPMGPWHYKFIASEARLISFYLVASGAAPPSHWSDLVRTVQRDQGEWFFVSSYEDGGAYMPYMASLYIDERHTLMGLSQANYTRSQIKHAAEINAPVWGWSASLDTRGEYVPYGQLRDEIVSPYASMLALMHFPEKATENLKKLEELGARPPTTFRNIQTAYTSLVPQGENLKPWVITNGNEVLFRNKFNGLEKLSSYIEAPEKTTPTRTYDRDAIRKLAEVLGYPPLNKKSLDDLIEKIIPGKNSIHEILNINTTPEMLSQILSLAPLTNLYSLGKIIFPDGKTYFALFTKKDESLKPWAIANQEEVYFINKYQGIEKLSTYLETPTTPLGTPLPYNSEALKKLLKTLNLTKEQKQNIDNLDALIKEVIPGTTLKPELENSLESPFLLGELLSLANKIDIFTSGAIVLQDGTTIPAIVNSSHKTLDPWAIQNAQDISFINKYSVMDKLSHYKTSPSSLGYDPKNLALLLNALDTENKVFKDKPVAEIVERVIPETSVKGNLVNALEDPALAEKLLTPAAQIGLYSTGKIELKNGSSIPAAFIDEGEALEPWAMASTKEVFFVNQKGSIEKLTAYIQTSNQPTDLAQYDQSTLLKLLNATGITLGEDEKLQDILQSINPGNALNPAILGSLISPDRLPEILSLASKATVYLPGTLALQDGTTLQVIFLKDEKWFIPWAISNGEEVFFLNKTGGIENLSSYLKTPENLNALQNYKERPLRSLLDRIDPALSEETLTKDYVEEILSSTTVKETLLEKLKNPYLLGELLSLATTTGIYSPENTRLTDGTLIPSAFIKQGSTLSPWAVANANDTFFLNARNEVRVLSDFIDKEARVNKINNYDKKEVQNLINTIGYEIPKGKGLSNLIQKVKPETPIKNELITELIDPNLRTSLLNLATKTNIYSPAQIQIRTTKTENFGFRDALDWQTGKVSKEYLTPSQAMGFLAIANVLFDGIVWKSFAENPAVASGLSILKPASEAGPLFNQQASNCLCEVSLQTQ